MSDFIRAQNNIGEFLKRYADSIRQMVTDPSAFYLHQADKGGFIEATVFALMNIVLQKLFYSLIMVPFTFGLSMVFLIPSIMYQWLLIVFIAVILFGMIRFFNGRGDFEAVYRSSAYASTATLLMLIPIPLLNILLFAAGTAYLLYFALREVHGLNHQQTVIALVVPVLLILLLGVIMTFMILFIIIRGLITLMTMI